MFQKYIDQCIEDCYQELIKTQDIKIKKLIKKISDVVGKKYQEEMLKSLVADMITNILEEEVPEELCDELIIEMLETVIASMQSMKKMYTLKITLDDCDNKVYRTIKVPAGFLLADLGYVILSTFNSEYSHLFSFIIKKQRYLCDVERELEHPQFVEEAFATNFSLSDFNFKKKSKFQFWYDYGEDYMFTIEVVDIVNNEELLTREDIEVIDGQGFGILEDNHHILHMYYQDKASYKQFLEENDLDKDMFSLEEELDIDTCNGILYDEFLDIKNAYENPPKEFMN